MSDSGRDTTETPRPYAALPGLVGEPRQLQLLGSLLKSNWTPESRKWLIDNSELEEDPKPAALAGLVDLLSRHPEKLGHLVVAWVSVDSCPLSRELLDRSIPFAWRRFDDVRDADEWLRAQL